MTTTNTFRNDAVVASFGYLHGAAPTADLIVDVRMHLRDPHVDPALREMTGKDAAVVERVLATPGAHGLIDALVAAVAALLPAACSDGRMVTVAVGCSGGRHRSVAIADAVVSQLTHQGWRVDAKHLHIGRPVVHRNPEKAMA